MNKFFFQIYLIVYKSWSRECLHWAFVTNRIIYIIRIFDFKNISILANAWGTAGKFNIMVCKFI